MKSKSVHISALLGTLLAATFALGSATASADGTLPAIPAVPSSALQPLTGADTLLTTFFSKSKIAGAIEKNGDYMKVLDNNGDERDPTTINWTNPDDLANVNFPFTFAGQIYVPGINQADGKLLATTGPVGSVAGTVLFPFSFADLAAKAYAYATGQGSMPAMPPVIKWTMKDITITDAGTTYVPMGSANVHINDAGLDGRAFTGLGPVEFGTLLNNTTTPPGLSMSVRMGGCFAVMGVSGPNTGKIGTYCLNSTFTFDLSGIKLGDAMLTSSITGKGSSNCITVLHTPMQMPQ